jgi:hypothetical protein
LDLVSLLVRLHNQDIWSTTIGKKLGEDRGNFFQGGSIIDKFDSPRLILKQRIYKNYKKERSESSFQFAHTVHGC